MPASGGGGVYAAGRPQTGHMKAYSKKAEKGLV